jgi:hypothetical protein
LGKTDPKVAGDEANHTRIVHAATIDPIHQSSLESDSEDDKEVYMVGHGDQLLEKTAEQIQREAEEEITRAAHLARDAERGKMHNDL